MKTARSMTNGELRRNIELCLNRAGDAMTKSQMWLQKEKELTIELERREKAHELLEKEMK
ncbi:MAG: hypothetical protein LBV19_06170 [Streptococcaceae bacterium]|nr:hypothetical protein [Streptococcaceae bacterium]